MQFESPSYNKKPVYVTGTNQPRHFKTNCPNCSRTIKLDLERQITNSWAGRSKLLSDEQLATFKRLFGIGLSGKSHDGGYPVFDQLTCPNCRTVYFTYCGVDEFANSAYSVTIQSIFDEQEP